MQFGFFRLFRLFRALLAWGILVVVGSLLIIKVTIESILQEMRYHRLYGGNWVQIYEKYEEPLSQTNFKIGLGIAYVIAMLVFAGWLYHRSASKKSHRRRRRHHSA
jgi:membrane protease YdiL (CAAX protease family)